ncbi:hypothetical protein EMCRGX_G021194 [Ephydatia muelleri]
MAGGTLRASTLTNHVKPMTASWCGTPGRTQGKPALPWSQVGQRGGPTTHHDHVMVVARLVAPKASQRYLGPRFGLMELADSDLHVAISLLRICGGFCKLVHISRTTPPSLSSEALHAFDGETRSCFSACLAADVTDAAWQQAQLSLLPFGGLGLRSLALHSSSAFLASFSASGVGNTNNLHLQQSLITFNSQVSHFDAVTIESVLADQPRQRSLSQKLDRHLFESLLMSSFPANKARLLSASAPHASAWLSAAPSVGLNLHLHSPEFQTAVRWWLGLDTSVASVCPFCPGVALDSLSHHAVPVDMEAHLSVRVEVGHGMRRDINHSCPADVLVEGWERGQPAALDITVTSPLTPVSLKDSSRIAGVAALSAETRKHAANDPKCRELGWMCIPMAVETYGFHRNEGVGTNIATVTTIPFTTATTTTTNTFISIFTAADIKIKLSFSVSCVGGGKRPFIDCLCVFMLKEFFLVMSLSPGCRKNVFIFATIVRSLSHQSSHSRKCTSSDSYPLASPGSQSNISNSSALPSDVLPSLEEVFSLKCATIRFIPNRAKHAFARALSSTLQTIVSENSLELKY